MLSLTRRCAVLCIRGSSALPSEARSGKVFFSNREISNSKDIDTTATEEVSPKPADSVGDRREEAYNHIQGHFVCPLSKEALKFDKDTSELISTSLGLGYPVIDGVPVLIPRKARFLDTAESTHS